MLCANQQADRRQLRPDGGVRPSKGTISPPAAHLEQEGVLLGREGLQAAVSGDHLQRQQLVLAAEGPPGEAAAVGAGGDGARDGLVHKPGECRERPAWQWGTR